MQTTNYSLPELLERASRKTLTIPRFQRDFTWSRAQVSLLVDSMSRSYPIGSLLLLLRNPNFEIGSRSIEAVVREQDQNRPDGGLQGTQSTDENHYILDGQQRITSIFRVFRNADPDKICYFDLRKVFEDHDKNATDWIRFLDGKDAENPPERKSKNRLLRADLIFDQSKTDIYVQEYIEDSGTFDELDKNAKREAGAKVKGVFETIRNYKVPVVVLERESGVESVCRVFETINSTGTRLTTFDLAVARFYDLDLRSMWERTLNEHQILRQFEVDGERVLQVLYLLHANERDGANYDPTRSNMFKLDKNHIKQNWETSSKALAQTFRWARSNGARPKSEGMKKTLPNESLLVPLAAYLGVQERNTHTDIFGNNVLRRWYFSKIMKSGVQASNYQISQNFLTLKQYRDGKQLEPEDVFLDVKAILDLKPSDVRYKSLQNVFAIKMRQDFFGAALDDNAELDDHHIFPRNAKKFGLPTNLLDSICNRVWLSRSINRSIRDKLPEEYLGKLAEDARKSGTLPEFKERMSDCLIPGDPTDLSWEKGFTVNNFQDFCQKRAELVLKEVGNIVGHAALKTASRQDKGQIDYVD